LGLRRGSVAGRIAEDVKSEPQALKRLHIFSGLVARLKSGPSPNLRESEFFREAESLSHPKSEIFPAY